MLEKLEEEAGYSRQGSQLWAAFHERNYDRASKIANSPGPYTTPKKEKPPKEYEVESNVMSLELAKITAMAVDDINVITSNSEQQNELD